MFQNVVIGWLARRGLELGGLIGGITIWYQSLSPAEQSAINRILAGDWQEIPLGSVVLLLVSIGGYIWSFRSTVQPQVVTRDAQKIPLPKAGEGSGTTAKVETIAAGAPVPKKLWERLTNR